MINYDSWLMSDRAHDEYYGIDEDELADNIYGYGCDWDKEKKNDKETV